MSSTVKIILIFSVLAVIAFFVWRFAKQKKEKAEADEKQKLILLAADSGNIKAIIPGTNGQGVQDLKSGGLNVSDMANGLHPDNAAPAPADPGQGRVILLPVQPSAAAPEVAHAVTGSPAVTDIQNGLAPDLASNLTAPPKTAIA